MRQIYFLLGALALFATGAVLFCHHSCHKLEEQAQLVPWNFTSCANGTLNTQNVSLGAQPAKSQLNAVWLFQVATAQLQTKDMKIEQYYKGIWTSTDVDNGFKNNLTANENLTYKYPFVIQGGAPSGDYSIKFTAYDNSKNVVGCTEVPYTI